MAIGTTTAAIIGAGAALGGPVLGGLMNQGGANGAAGAAGAAGQQGYGAAQNAADAAWLRGQGTAQQARVFTAPYTQAGYGATKEILNLLGLGTLNPMSTGEFSYGDTSLNETDRAGNQANALSRFQTSPDYSFRVGQGVQALDRSANARGRLMSGAQDKAITEYGQKMGSEEYGNYFNRLAGVAGLGAGAANSTNAIATGALSSANNASTGIMSPGINALTQGGFNAANYGAQGSNAMANGISGGINNLAGYGAYMNWFNPGGSSGDPAANLSGFTNGQGPLGPSGRY